MPRNFAPEEPPERNSVIKSMKFTNEMHNVSLTNQMKA